MPGFYRVSAVVTLSPNTVGKARDPEYRGRGFEPALDVFFLGAIA